MNMAVDGVTGALRALLRKEAWITLVFWLRESLLTSSVTLTMSDRGWRNADR